MQLTDSIQNRNRLIAVTLWTDCNPRYIETVAGMPDEVSDRRLNYPRRPQPILENPLRRQNDFRTETKMQAARAMQIQKTRRGPPIDL